MFKKILLLSCIGIALIACPNWTSSVFAAEIGQNKLEGKAVSVSSEKQKIENENKSASVELSRENNADLIIIDRKKIDGANVKNVYELLKQQAGFSISVDGRPTLEGFSGPLKILVNGLVPPDEKNPMAFKLDEIETIRIIKPVLDGKKTSTNAATINILMRNVVKVFQMQTCLDKCSASGVSETDCK